MEPGHPDARGPGGAPAWARRRGDGWVLAVRVQPGARRSEVVGPVAWDRPGDPDGEALKVRIAAPPVDGRANAALVAFVAGWLGVSRRSVSVEHGGSGRSKVVAVTAPIDWSLVQRPWEG